jgi:aquaporin Z
MNPARTLGPDLVSGDYPLLWAYFAGPVAGAVAAVALYYLTSGERRTLTAKLFHDERYPSVHASALPARAAPPGPGDRAHADPRNRVTACDSTPTTRGPGSPPRG